MIVRTRNRLPITAIAAALALCAGQLPLVTAASADEPAPIVAPVPGAAAQENAQRIVKDLFKDQIDGAKNAAGKLELAKMLLQKGADTQGDAAGEYVLLKMARDYALAAADAGVAMQCVEELAKNFQLDGLALRVETLTALAKATLPPAQAKSFAETASSVAEDALAVDNFEVAKQAAAIGLAAAKKTRDADLNKQLASRTKEIDSLEDAYRSVKKAQAQLDEKPLDAAANLAVGRYRVLAKGDWERGVPMLALGNDPKLKELAVLELDATDSADDLLKLGSSWAEYGATVEGSARDRVEARSLFWYAKALPLLNGLEKVKIEKVLQDASAKLYNRIQAALRAKKYTISRAVGSNRGAGFADALDEGGLLIGFEIGTIDINGQKVVRSIRPLYRCSRGDVPGQQHGQNRSDFVTLKAKDGFAVGSVTVKAGAHIEAIAVSFMQVEGLALNPRNAYNSPWAGDGTGGETRLGGGGSPVVGITGRILTGNGGATVLESLSIISLK